MNYCKDQFGKDVLAVGGEGSHARMVCVYHVTLPKMLVYLREFYSGAFQLLDLDGNPTKLYSDFKTMLLIDGATKTEDWYNIMGTAIFYHLHSEFIYLEPLELDNVLQELKQSRIFKNLVLGEYDKSVSYEEFEKQMEINSKF